MKVAIVYWDSSQQSKLKEVASALSQGVESQGHDVKVFNGCKDDLFLTGFDYILMGTKPLSYFSKQLDSAVVNSLARAGSLMGKRCFAFVLKQGLRSFRVLETLMKKMESQGMMLKFSELISNPEEAKYLASKLHIKK